MKKLILFMALITFAATSCQNEGKPTPLAIDNALTAAEIEAGILSPEVMWKMGRVGSSSLSPDGTQVAYTVTYYNMAENRGVTSIYVQPIEGGEPRQLTDNAGNDVSPQWAADSHSIFFLSNRSGSMQIWNVTTADAMLRQVSSVEGDIEAFGIAPTGEKVYYIQPVHVKDILSKDVYEDMDKSKARIYDDLMARHWSYWDEGDYRHIFVADFDSTAGISIPMDIIGTTRSSLPE